MKKILLASLAVAASASMMAQTTNKLMEFKFDNTTMKDQVSGVEIPLAQGTPIIVDGPVAGSKAMHFDGSTFFNLDDCTKIPGTQLGTKEWSIVTWFKFDGTTNETAVQGCFIEVGSTAEALFYQGELQGSTPAPTLTFFGRINGNNNGKFQAANSLVEGDLAAADQQKKHFVCDGNWHMMVGVKSNAAEGPNWYVVLDGVVSDDSDVDPNALSYDMKNASWDDGLNGYRDIRVPYTTANNYITRSNITTAELNYKGNLSIGNNYKDEKDSNNPKRMVGTLYSITVYDGVATTEQMQSWFKEVYPDYYSATGGIQDVTVAPADENAPMYNLQGVQVDENYKGIVIKNGKKFVNR